MPVVVHGARLLAGLLLVRSDLHGGQARHCARAAPRGMMTRCVRPRAGAALAAGAAADSVHAREPRAQAARARGRRRGHRRQLGDRRRPAGARAGAGGRAHRHDSESRRHDRRSMRRASAAPPPMPDRTCSMPASSRPTRASQYLVDVAGQGRPAVAARRRRRRPARGDRRGRGACAGSDVRLTGWVDRSSHRGVDAARDAAGLSVVRTGVAEPRAHRGRALGVPIAAMDTGGTRDIVVHGRDGAAVGDAGGARARRRPARGATTACGSARRSGAAPRRTRFRRRRGRRARRAGLRRSARQVRGPPEMQDRCVAVVARAVMPLHGVGGLERPVHDLVRASRAARRRRHAHRAAASGAGATPDERSRPAHHAAARALPHVSVRQPPRHDGPRSQHGVSALRLARRPAPRAISCAAARSTSSTASAPACSATRGADARGERPAPLVLNPQGLEEFGATSPSRAGAEARRLRAAALGGASPARAPPTASSRPIARSSRSSSRTCGSPPRQMRDDPERLDLDRGRARWPDRPTARVMRRRHGIAPGETVLLERRPARGEQGLRRARRRARRARRARPRSRRPAGAG